MKKLLAQSAHQVAKILAVRCVRIEIAEIVAPRFGNGPLSQASNIQRGFVHDEMMFGKLPVQIKKSMFFFAAVGVALKHDPQTKAFLFLGIPKLPHNIAGKILALPEIHHPLRLVLGDFPLQIAPQTTARLLIGRLVEI